MRMHALRVTALLVGAAFAQQAFASGYHFGTQSVSAQGTANASGAAAEDASTVFYNPAGLSNLKGTTASGVLNIVIPSGDYTDKGSYTAAGPSFKTGGNNGGEFVKTTAVPHAYFSHQLNDQLTLGFGAFVPFGSKTQYDENWAGRYNIIKTELKTIALNPSFSFKLNDVVSLGGGLTAQFIEGKLVKGADFGTAIAQGVLTSASFASLPAATQAALRPQLLAMIGNPNYSGQVNIKGDDWGFGWNLGVMFNFDEGTRVGLAYRSKIRHELSGNADWTLSNGFASNTSLIALGQAALINPGLQARGYVDGPANLGVDTPESLSLSGFKQINDRLALMADVTRTRHSRFEALTVNFTTGLPPSNTPEKWEDTTKVSVGGSYQLNDALKLRAGLAFDESPVEDANRTPSIPDSNRKWLSLGANWAMSKDSSVDLAYSFVKVGKPAVNNYDNGGLAPTVAQPRGACDSTRNTSSCATLVGEYDVYSHIVGVQFNQRF